MLRHLCSKVTINMYTARKLFQRRLQALEYLSGVGVLAKVPNNVQMWLRNPYFKLNLGLSNVLLAPTATGNLLCFLNLRSD